MKQILFIEAPDYQKVIHLFAVPYIVECGYRGRFYHVLNIDETEVEFEDVKELVLKKHLLLDKNRILKGLEKINQEIRERRRGFKTDIISMSKQVSKPPKR